MENLLEEANFQRNRLEVSANDELRVLTNDVRTELIKNEVELRKEIHLETSKKEKRMSSNIALKKEIKQLTYKYKEFQNTRKVEVNNVLEEIRKLRQLMVTMKQQYATNRSSHNQYNQQYKHFYDEIENQLNATTQQHKLHHNPQNMFGTYDNTINNSRNNDLLNTIVDF